MKKKTISLIIAYVILTFSLCACASPFHRNVYLINRLSQVNFDIDYPVGQITQSVTVTQDFISNADSVSQIWLYGATYMRDNTATVSVKLYRADGYGDDSYDPDGLICEWTLDSSEMEDNTVIKLDADPSDNNTGLKGTRCMIVISSPDGEPDLSPTFWMTEEDVYPDGHLSINGYAQYNDLWFQVKGH